MKYEKVYLIIIIMLILSGCSFKTGDNSDSDLSATPEITNQITPTQVPTQALTPTTSPTAAPTPTVTKAPVTPSITEVPSDASDYEKAALDILDHMTLEEKIGQMFFVRCKAATAKADIIKYHLGGYVLFAADFENKTKAIVKKNIQSYQKASDIPMLIGVDEEGGTVNRISKYNAFRAVPFQSPQELYQKGGYDLIVSDTLEKADLLKRLGINVNLAPVCDVSTNAADFIYKRSFGKSAKQTSEYVKTIVTTMNSENIGCTLKHFPGYGNNVDTHTGIAVDKRKSETFYQSDFLPFLAGIKAGAGSILVSHNIVNCFDSKQPASLSPAIHEILRNELGFDGVIMTDDLSMDAIKQYTNEEEAAVTAVLAGNDLLIASDYDIQIPAVIAAVKDKKITEDRLEESVYRILLWKLSLGIIQVK